jgi:fatty acid desaturase
MATSIVSASDASDMSNSTSGEFSFRQAREILGDLFIHRAWIYWLDLAVTLTIGYGCAMIYLKAPAFSALQIATYLIAGFALFRAGSFIHEITHLRKGELLAFRVAWNILCGIPMLMPSFFYENHIDHHNSKRYGTIRDGEYLPLGSGTRWRLLTFWLQVPVLPLYIFTRLLLGPITFLNPKWRNWTLAHASSFVINFHHQLEVPPWAPRKWWALLEVGCSLRAAILLVLLLTGVRSATFGLEMYLLAVMTLGLNYIRNMAAHRYRNESGQEMSHIEQLEDSVNIVGGPLTEMFFPLGLRYHALHHLFPSLPYHNLYEAHRRMMAELPADSPYRKTVFPSFWAVLHALWTDRSERELSDKPQTVQAA